MRLQTNLGMADTPAVRGRKSKRMNRQQSWSFGKLRQSLMQPAPLIGLMTLLIVAVILPIVLSGVGIDANQRPDLRARMLPPLTDGYILGTDSIGRDNLIRLLSGAVISVWMALGAGTFALGFGMGLLWASRQHRWLIPFLRQYSYGVPLLPFLLLSTVSQTLLANQALTLNPSPNRRFAARRGTSKAVSSPSPSAAFGRRGREMRAKSESDQLTNSICLIWLRYRTSTQAVFLRSVVVRLRWLNWLK